MARALSSGVVFAASASSCSSQMCSFAIQACFALHLDARSSWRKLHRSLGAGRVRQVQWLLEALRDDDAYAVLAGDLNSWAGGANEPALRMLRERGFVHGTPLRESSWTLVRLLRTFDHVLYRLPSGAAAHTREIRSAYGSDHRPLLGSVRLDPD